MVDIKVRNVKFGVALMLVFVFSLYVLSPKHVAKTFSKNIYPRQKQTTTTTTTTEPATTTTPYDNSLTLDDVTHTIKTSQNFHNTRDEPILLTWFRQVAAQSYFITDKEDLAFSIKAHPGHVVVSRCAGSHDSGDLNCKMNTEFDTLVDNGGATKWWCHWDDDNYVNIRALFTLLEQYDPREPWYIGRSSITYPQPYNYRGKRVTAWFAHGGCGFCISKPLVDRMVPHVYGGKLMDYHRKIYSNDDCTIGFIVNYILGVELTQSALFNSHYHRKELMLIPTDRLKDQISLSYSTKRGEECAAVINGSVNSFPVGEDPTRFYSIHCLANPDVPYCNVLLDDAT